MAVIAWSLNVLATGLFPDFAHDGTPFQHEWRSLMRGFPLAEGLCGALVEMRADLLEFVSALGFRRWDNVLSPCFCCNSFRDDVPSRGRPPHPSSSSSSPRGADGEGRRGVEVTCGHAPAREDCLPQGVSEVFRGFQADEPGAGRPREWSGAH